MRALVVAITVAVMMVNTAAFCEDQSVEVTIMDMAQSYTKILANKVLKDGGGIVLKQVPGDNQYMALIRMDTDNKASIRRRVSNVIEEYGDLSIIHTWSVYEDMEAIHCLIENKEYGPYRISFAIVQQKGESYLTIQATYIGGNDKQAE